MKLARGPAPATPLAPSPSTLLIRLNGRILSVGDGSIEIDVSPPGEAVRVISLPAQRGQEEWAGARIYKQVNVTIEVKGET